MMVVNQYGHMVCISCLEYCLFLHVEYCLSKAFVVPQQFGRLPIELAAEYGTQEDVEILFPFTSPISTVENWSVDGIISHVKMEIKQLEVCPLQIFLAHLRLFCPC